MCSHPPTAGGLRYGLVSNFYDLEKAGTWQGGDMSMSDRLLALHCAGAEFNLATGDEITAIVASDTVRTSTGREAAREAHSRSLSFAHPLRVTQKRR